MKQAGIAKKQNAIIFTFSEAYKFGDEVTTIETKKKENYTTLFARR